MLQRSCENLASTFQRPVIGVHNRSYGAILDLIECLIQRSFHYETQDVRVAEASLQDMLEDESVKKVVVIAHSQGGLIVSLVLDRLYSIVPAHLFAKLEIYTFGSAAAQFHNPLTSQSKARSEPATPIQSKVPSMASSSSAPPVLSAPPEMRDRLIPTIEHYVNRKDLVPTWGVLYHIILGTGTTYSGRVFVHEKASGHLFDEHYLGPMLPLLDMHRIQSGDKECFVNHAVTLSDSSSARAGIWCAQTFAGDSGAREVNGDNDGEEFEDQDGGLPGKPRTRKRGKVPGMTVKQLSKLWRYLDGREA